MITPTLNELDSSRDMISSFGGLHPGMNCGENEFSNEQNMSADYYPAMAPRKKIGIAFETGKIYGMYSKNGLIYVEDGTLYYDKNPLLGEAISHIEELEKSQKMMCGMGANVLIWPDKKVFNTSDWTMKDMGAKKQTSGTVSFTMCTLEGADITPITKAPTVGKTAPTSAQNGDYWIDTSSQPNVLKKYTTAWGIITTCSNGAIYWMDTGTTPNVLKLWNESESQWTAVATSYTKISNKGIGTPFEQYDVVHIEGVTGDIASTFNQDMAIWDKKDDFIIVTALLTNNTSQTGVITLERRIPDMDFVCESENRVWGCSNEKHEIYCCKQGDPTNWYSYLGTAADSYAATIGSDGDFTGCCAYGGQVLFFKEDCIHKVYGNCPSNYQITTSYCRGVQKGCEKSLAIVNEVLYYKSRDDICVYDGSSPISVSSALGPMRCKKAEAGALGSKYYIYMDRYENGTVSGSGTFVYDTSNGLWHKDSEENRQMFTYYDGTLYCWEKGRKRVVGISMEKIRTKFDPENDFEWMAETGLIGLSYPNNKYVSKICMRLSMPLASTLSVDVMYDSSGEWKEEITIESKYEEDRRDTPAFVKMRSYEIPILPMRCDHMRVRFRGKGDVRIYSISKVTEQGGI